jgi:hypothetical protein
VSWSKRRAATQRLDSEADLRTAVVLARLETVAERLESVAGRIEAELTEADEDSGGGDP